MVRRIFEMAAAGAGFKRIAAALNDEHVPAPVPRRAGRPRGWAPPSIREMLYRELYRGVIVWNRSQKIIRSGAKHQRLRPAGDWLRVEAPALRIVPDEVWNAVHERLAASRAMYLRSTNGHAHGRPANGIESPYLLTGLASCAACGGGMFVHTRHHGRQRVPFFGCSTYHLRGRAICENNLEVPLGATDEAVLDAIEHDLLRVEVLETALAKALDLLRPSPDVLDGRAQRLRDELAQLDVEVTRLAGAIASDGELSALLVALQEREQRRARVRTELGAIERVTGRRDDLDAPRVIEDLRRLLADWRGLLRQEAPHARPALTALLAGRLVFTPKGVSGERYYEFSGPGTLDKVIAGLAFPMAVVAPMGSHSCQT